MMMVVGFSHNVMAEEEMAEAEEEASISGWFRTDTDNLGTQIWFGASHTLGGLDIESDIYTVGTTGELDIGPSFTLSEGEDMDFSVLPMVGLVFDFGTTDITTLVPQFYTYLTMGDIYFESWVSAFLSSLFDDNALDTTDTFYTRNFLLYSVSDVVAVGPQVEVTLNLEDAGAGVPKLDSLASLMIGGRINLAYGENNTLGLFLGVETEAPDNSDGITGRFTFVREW